MNDAYFAAFEKYITADVYVAGDLGQRVTQHIQEEKYAFDLLFKVRGAHGVAFRIEDFKEKANYLIGGKRGHGMDNDCTIIDQAIFQIEVKETKTMGNMHAGRQFNGGLKWLRHILEVVVTDQVNLQQTAKMEVYNVVIRRDSRTSLSRVGGYAGRQQGANYMLHVNKSVKQVDLTKAMLHLLQHEQPAVAVLKLDD
ncbi:hypothetical protein D8911_03975 [Levilactobacillus brevis]|nr:hypothetical protein D8911_03975 [Levilactobacillus brevis]